VSVSIEIWFAPAVPATNVKVVRTSAGDVKRIVSPATGRPNTVRVADAAVAAGPAQVIVSTCAVPAATVAPDVLARSLHDPIEKLNAPSAATVRFAPSASFASKKVEPPSMDAWSLTVPLVKAPVAARVPSPPSQSITVLLALDEMVSIRFTPVSVGL